MLGPCLVLLIGGASPSAPAWPAVDPAVLRLYPAVVVPEDALQGAPGLEDLDPATDPPAPVPSGKGPDGDVTLHKAATRQTPDLDKEP